MASGLLTGQGSCRRGVATVSVVRMESSVWVSRGWSAFLSTFTWKLASCLANYYVSVRKKRHRGFSQCGIMRRKIPKQEVESDLSAEDPGCLVTFHLLADPGCLVTLHLLADPGCSACRSERLLCREGFCCFSVS